MSAVRQSHGAETRDRLQKWEHTQASTERLAAAVLQNEGFHSIDPIHPLGGPDGLADVICVRKKKKFIAAAYFPHAHKAFPELKKKFKGDLNGVKKHSAKGFAFVTNQKLTKAERKVLSDLDSNATVEIYHVDRLVTILNTPAMYGIRLEHLGIEMTKEEQLAFIATRDKALTQIQCSIADLFKLLERATDPGEVDKLRAGVPLAEIQDFKATLESITSRYGSSFAVLGTHPTVHDLRVPLAELKEYVGILRGMSNPTIAYSTLNPLIVPLPQLREFKQLLDEIVGTNIMTIGPITRLRVPLEQLREYEEALDRILQKQRQLNVQPLVQS